MSKLVISVGSFLISYVQRDTFVVLTTKPGQTEYKKINK